MPKGVYKRTTNKGWFKKGNTNYKNIIFINRREGEKNHNWMGEKAGYFSKHCWIRDHYGSANHCEICGKDKIPEGYKKYFVWANLDHKYVRDIKYWKQMCYSCHRKYDIKLRTAKSLEISS